MEIRHFTDTDTLHIQLRDNEVAETIEVNQNIYFDVDNAGNPVALTLEHASEITNIIEAGKMPPPIEKLEALWDAADFWSEDELVDDFIANVRAWRKADS